MRINESEIKFKQIREKFYYEMEESDKQIISNCMLRVITSIKKVKSIFKELGTLAPELYKYNSESRELIRQIEADMNKIEKKLELCYEYDIFLEIKNVLMNEIVTKENNIKNIIDKFLDNYSIESFIEHHKKFNEKEEVYKEVKNLDDENKIKNILTMLEKTLKDSSNFQNTAINNAIIDYCMVILQF